MANIITQVDGAGALIGGADDDFIVAQHLNGAGVPNPQVLSGGAGDDVIFGDHDELFVDTGAGNDSIATALNIDNIQSWGQRENPDVENSTTIPYTSVLAIGAGATDFFSVFVGAGESLTVDLDYGSTDHSGSDSLSIDVFDAAGGALGFSDNASDSLGAFGSQEAAGNDPFLTFTNTTGSGQTVFIRVAQTSSLGPVPVGVSYMLNVSVTNHVMSNFAVFGNDQIDGGAGDDVLYGGEGDDVINGGADDDLIEGGSGADTMDGGAGVDTLSYVSSEGGVAVDMLSGVSSNFGAGFGHGTGDTFTNFENVIGSEFGDLFAPGTGANVIDGRGGFDFVSYGSDDAALTADLETGVVSGGPEANGDTLISIEAITGTNDFGDTIRGSSVNNVINGQGGDDFLAGRGGADTLNGGAGRDTADYSESANGVQVDLLAGTASGGDAAGDTLNDIENVTGSQVDDTLTGDNNDNTLRGNDGVDVITGNGGADNLVGGGGDDVISGGAGTDTLEGEAGNDTLSGGADSDVLIGGAGNDTLNGDGGNDTLDGGNDNDVLIGGAGNDTLRDTGNATSSVQSDDILDGGAGDDILEANFGFDQFIGGSGIDTLQIAGSVVDVSPNGPFDFDIDLEAGTDTFGNTYSGIENVNGGVGNDTIIGDAEDNVIDGGDGNDTIDGGDGNDIIRGGDGDDILSDGRGADIVEGGAGNDLFRLTAGNGEFTSPFDSFDGGTGIDTFETSVNFADTSVFDMQAGTYEVAGFTVSVTNMENFDGSGQFTTQAKDIRGTSGDNIITTSDASDDTIEGRAGADTLDGGAGGSDTLSYASSDAGVVINLEASLASGGHAAGDMISNFENVTGSALGDNLIGDGGDNVLIGGAGDDSLRGLNGRDEHYGEAGDDRLFTGNDAASAIPAGSVFDGGTGTDTVVIQSQSPTRTIDLRDATVTDIEQLAFFTTGASAGDLTAQITVAQALSSGLASIGVDARNGTDSFNVEFFMDAVTVVNLSGFNFTNGYGTAADDTVSIIGDGDDETITGTSITDIINGGGGDDTFAGGLGADTLNGGAGIDTITFEDATAGVGAQLNVNIGFRGEAAGDTYVSIENIIGSDFDDIFVAGSAINNFDAGAGDDVVGMFSSEDGAGNVFDGGTGDDRFEVQKFSNTSIDLRDDTLLNFETLEFNISGGSVLDSASILASQLAQFGTIQADAHSGQSITLNIDMGGETSLDLSAFSITGFTEPGDTFVVTGDGDDEFVQGTPDVAVTANLGGGSDYYVTGGAQETIDLGSDDDILQIGSLPVAAGSSYDGGTGSLNIVGVVESGVTDLTGATFTNFEELHFVAIGDTARTIEMTDTQVAALTAIDGNEANNGLDNLDISVTSSGDVDFSGLTFRDWGTGTGNQFDLVVIRDDNTAGQSITGTSQNDFFFDDSGTATNSVDNLFGGAGNDTFMQNDFAVIDNIDGGSGFDAVDYGSIVTEALGFGITADMTNDTVSYGAFTRTLIDIESVRGSQINDSITSGAESNIIRGKGGDDILIDNFDASVVDEFDGGDGIDTLIVTAIQWGPDMLFDLMDGVQRFGSGFSLTSDTYLDIENVTVNGRAQIRGDDGDNVLTAITGPGAGGPGSFANIINAEGGNDTVFAGDDDDVVNGGFGNDELFGEAGDDLLIGGLGDDLLDGGDGTDTVSYADAGGRVAVFLNRAPGDIGSGEGIDTFVSIENIIGSDFDDRIVGDAADNHFLGGLGNDVLIGNAGNDTLDGGAGDDELNGSGGNDTLIGGDGNDQMFGLGGADSFDGGAGNDLIEGGLGVDFIDGGIGDDEILGFFGVDTIFGGNGFDNIRADGSGDFVDGGGGNDRIVGGNGKDTLFGGTGNDTLFGGGGNGAGDGLRDVFVFKSAANGDGGFDIIRDFEDTIDKIDLSESGYTTFADVFADAAQVGANVEINFDFSGILRIENFLLADLTAGDFLF